MRFFLMAAHLCPGGRREAAPLTRVGFLRMHGLVVQSQARQRSELRIALITSVGVRINPTG